MVVGEAVVCAAGVVGVDHDDDGDIVAVVGGAGTGAGDVVVCGVADVIVTVVCAADVVVVGLF